MFSPSDVSQLQAMSAAAGRISNMIHTRAVQAYCQAFGVAYDRDSRLCMSIIHNSIIDFDRGRSWSGVDYSHMRRARWLCEKGLEPSRLVTAWYRRKSGLKAEA